MQDAGARTTSIGANGQPVAPYPPRDGVAPVAIDLAIDASLGDPRAGWQFHLEDPTPRHRLALAVRLPEGHAPKVSYRWVGPAAPGRLG